MARDVQAGLDQAVAHGELVLARNFATRSTTQASSASIRTAMTGGAEGPDFCATGASRPLGFGPRSLPSLGSPIIKTVKGSSSKRQGKDAASC